MMMWIHAIWIGLLAAVVFELITIALRFGLGWRSPERTSRMGRVTKGWRVHHGYPGLLMMPAAALPLPTALITPVADPAWFWWIGPALLVFGIMLAVSDLIHHAIVLPRYAGSHEFELHYPGHPRHKPAPITREPRPFPLRRAA
jgi:hypothetical protein